MHHPEAVLVIGPCCFSFSAIEYRICLFVGNRMYESVACQDYTVWLVSVAEYLVLMKEDLLGFSIAYARACTFLMRPASEHED